VSAQPWPSSAGWTRIRTVDAHAAGEPLRVVVAGLPPIPGATMLAKRRHARERLDHLRRLLMWEPRGHADMYGAVPTEPVTPDGDLGVLFLHNEGYSTMCGHGILALVTVALETGWPAIADPRHIAIDTPAGRVTAQAWLEGGRVTRVSFENVPSFVLRRDLEVDVAGLGRLRCDVAFGGAFYAFVDAADVGLRLAPEEAGAVIDAGRRVTRAVAAACDVRHPDGDPDLGFLYGTILVAPAQGEAHSRHACVFAQGELDRSPTGTGVAARAALLAADGALEPGRWIAIESLVGTRFEVRVVRSARAGGLEAVVPEVAGRAFLTGRHELVLAPDDPLGPGFLLR
jgi:trans-L-3-hydroxyproline dehydratase